jgi:hypothetical protein
LKKKAPRPSGPCLGDSDPSFRFFAHFGFCLHF